MINSNELLEKDDSFSIHIGNIHILGTEIYSGTIIRTGIAWKKVSCYLRKSA